MKPYETVTALSKQRRNDLWLILGIAAAVAILAVLHTVTRAKGDYAVVLREGQEVARYSLRQEETVSLGFGDDVTNVLVIENGKARIEKANCPDQICVKHRAVFREGDTIVCLPNELVIKIEASAKGDAPDVVV